MRVHRLQATTSKTLRLAFDDLLELGVDMGRYHVRDYSVTKKIGAAVKFLELDGMITSSARWDCNNLTIFSQNHSLDNTLEILDHEEVDWHAWAKQHGIL